jgi:hypothetical protein
MNKRNKILSATFGLIVGLGLAMPMRALAENVNHQPDHHRHTWLWEKYQDHYRARPDDRGGAYGSRPGYAYGNRPLPANGQGMINDRNPNLYWACDSGGHHCHWARR